MTMFATYICDYCEREHHAPKSRRIEREAPPDWRFLWTASGHVDDARVLEHGLMCPFCMDALLKKSAVEPLSADEIEPDEPP